jgi:hypothetical protein
MEHLQSLLKVAQVVQMELPLLQELIKALLELVQLLVLLAVVVQAVLHKP